MKKEEKEEKDKKNNKFIIAVVFLILFGISVGYAIISRTFEFNGTTNIKGNIWNIEAPKDEDIIITPGSVDDKPHVETGEDGIVKINYTIDLPKPGDFLEFVTPIKNKGTIDAKLDSVIIDPKLSAEQEEYLRYIVVDADTGEQFTTEEFLKSETGILNVKIRVEYRNDDEVDTSKYPKDPVYGIELGCTLKFVQALDDIATEPSKPNQTGQSLIETLGLTATAPSDKEASTYVKASTGIDFGEISSDTNGKGLYLLDSTKDDKYPIYYYRGNITNNNIIFANFCWKIVRTTETGGTKLIYNGVPTDGTCDNTGASSQLTDKSTFNATGNPAKYVGYTYDDNEPSTIKGVIDKWYEDNIENDTYHYEKYLEDTVWCNDRSFAGTLYGTTYYGAYGRLETNKTPSLECPNQSDSYTLKESNINYNASLNGNKLLDYPVALLTADEVALAGGIGSNYKYYLYTGQIYWVLSPYGGDSYGAAVFNVYSYGQLVFNNVSVDYGVRPSVSLRLGTTATTEKEGEAGSVNNPYVVVEN